MSDNDTHVNDPMKTFTDAVKAIVSVPKDAASKPGDASHPDSHFKEVVCPHCGKRMILHTKHTHEKEE